MRKTALKRGTKQMKRTKLRVKGHSTTAELKKDIQALLRQIVIKRDGKCQRCGVEYGTEGVVFQCDHLISRSNSATYADSRLCVLVCKPCHAWKSLGSNLRKKEYDQLMRSRLPRERVALWETCEERSWEARRTGAFDWKLAKIVLEQELSKM